MGLSIKDILLLDYFDGKPAHHKVPPYKESGKECFKYVVYESTRAPLTRSPFPDG